jgi:RNA polymerase sigma factor (sigma-70 family)
MKHDPRLVRGEHGHARQWEQRRHQLYQRCLRLMGGNHADAEDAIGIAFVKLLSTGTELDAIKDIDAWLSRVAHNACLDTYRARKRRNEHSLTWEDWNQPIVVEPMLLEHEDPESHLLHREVTQLAAGVIETLPEDLRVPLLLRVEDDASYHDIAVRLCLTESNVRKRVQTARTLVTRAMNRATNGGPPASGRAARAKTGAIALERVAIPTSEALYPIAVADASGARRHVWLALDAPLIGFTAPRYRRYARYVDNHPTGWKMRLRFADMLLQASRLDEAAEHYRAVLACRRPLWRARWRLALCLQAAGRIDDTVRLFAEMQAEPAASPATRAHLRGRQELALGNPAQAEGAFGHAAALEPDHGAHWTALAALHRTAARPIEAWRALHRALAASPRDLQALVLAHDVAAELDQEADRVDLLARARAEHGQSAAVQIRLIEHRCHIGKLDRDTGAMVRSLLRAHPTLGEAHGCAALWWRACGRRGEALHVMRRFVQSAPTDGTGWRLLAREARAYGSIHEAEHASQQARELDPDRACAWLSNAS